MKTMNLLKRIRRGIGRIFSGEMRNSPGRYLWLSLVLGALTLPALTARANSDGFGLGFIAGDPTGVDGKLWLGRTTALDMAVAWSAEGDNDRMHLQVDHVWHDFSLINVDEGRLPVYYGVGARVRFADNGGDDNFGIRFPVGLDYLFKGNKVDLFGEIAPTLDLTPSTDLNLEGGIGLRYFFHQ